MYGTQTNQDDLGGDVMFENDVKMYGTQTVALPMPSTDLFENDIKFIFVNNKNR